MSEPGDDATGSNVSKGERWSRLSARAVVDRNLTATDVRVLAAIGIYAGRDGIAWPSQETVAGNAGIDRSTACRAVKRLLAGGYLDRYRKPTSRGRYRNVYRLLYPAYAPPRTKRGDPEM